VFTTAEFRASLPPRVSASTVLNRLLQAHRRGYVDRVHRGLYVSRVGVFADTIPDPLLVASKLAPDSVIAYHSALEAHGVAHAPFRRVTFLSARLPVKVQYRGYEFWSVRPAASMLRGSRWRSSLVQLRRGDQLIACTSRERTLADCLHRLRWSGGLEEVLRSVGALPSLDIERLLAYLDLLGLPTVVARVGWVLSLDPGLWGLTPEDLEPLRSRLGKGPYFLSARSGPQRLAGEWRLYVPQTLDAQELLHG